MDNQDLPINAVPEPFQGIDRRTYLAGCIFMGLCSLKETDPKKITPAIIVKKTDVLISELDKNK